MSMSQKDQIGLEPADAGTIADLLNDLLANARVGYTLTHIYTNYLKVS